MLSLGSWLLWVAFGAHFALTTFYLIGARRFLTAPTLEPLTNSVTQLTPVFNEAANFDKIASSIEQSRRLGQPAILVDDGSTDGSSKDFRKLAESQDAVFVEMPRNFGKASALNTGLARVSTNTVLTIDADTVTRVEEAHMIAGHLGTRADAIALRLVPAQPIKGLVALQRAEYAYIQTFERAALAGYGLYITVPGAASLWRRDALISAGGFCSRTLSEDTDMTLTLQAGGGRILLSHDHVAITGCPRNLALLVRQRARWTWGNLQAGLIHGWIAIFRGPQVANRLPGFAMLVLCVFKLAGYGIVTYSGLRFMLGSLGFADLAAVLAIMSSSLVRFFLTRSFVDPDAPPVVRALFEVTLIQLINFYAFWWGLVRGLPFSRKWK